MRQAFAIAAVLALGACKSGTIIEERIVEVSVPVPVGCATQRPSVPVPLKQRFSEEQWATMDVRQKAAAVSIAGLGRLAYGEDLNAATGACPQATSSYPPGER